MVKNDAVEYQFLEQIYNLVSDFGMLGPRFTLLVGTGCLIKNYMGRLFFELIEQ